mmetsp:Transcript_24522/g.56726  ORF Transcript_24522/g.56726 Transcript_24522/m.56726 type:complete len:567 (+) Transcript_24522:29-1729(+)
MSRLVNEKELLPVEVGCFKILRGHGETITCIHVSDDENTQGQKYTITVFTGSFDHTARATNLKTKESVQFIGHRSYVLCLKPSPPYLFTGSYDGTVRQWNIATQECVNVFKMKNDMMVVALEAWDEAFITATPDHVVRVWDAGGYHPGKLVHELKGHTRAIFNMQIVAGDYGCQEEELYTGSQDRTVRVWRHYTGECLKIFRFDTAPLTAMHLDAETDMLFVGAGETVYQTNVETGAEVMRYTCRNGAAKALEADYSQRQLLVASGSTVQVFDTETGINTRTMAGTRGQVIAIAVNHGALLLCGDNTVRVMDTIPLFWWAMDGNDKMLSHLLLTGDNIERKSISGSTALHYGCQHGKDNIVLSLMTNGADLFTTHLYDGEAGLHKAARNGSLSCVQALLKSGVDPNFLTAHLEEGVRTGEMGETLRGVATALHVAAECGHVDVLLELLRRDADVDAKCDLGLTPLMLAGSTGSCECVSALIAFNASLSLQCDKGLTALGRTKNKRCRSILARSVLRAGARKIHMSVQLVKLFGGKKAQTKMGEVALQAHLQTRGPSAARSRGGAHS